MHAPTIMSENSQLFDLVARNITQDTSHPPENLSPLLTEAVFQYGHMRSLALSCNNREVCIPDLYPLRSHMQI